MVKQLTLPHVKPEYKEILDRGAKEEALFKKLLGRWRTLPPKNLDQQLAEAQEKAFETIDCLACGNCCKGLGPLIRDREIPKLAKLVGVKQRVFEDTYLRMDEDGDVIFKSMPCMFLGSDLACGIYEDRPQACASYPHLDLKKQSSRTKELLADSAICPAVVLSLESFLSSLTV